MGSTKKLLKKNSVERDFLKCKGSFSEKSSTSMIKILKSTESKVELLDRWYIRLLALMITPLYALLKIYDLARFINNMLCMALGGLLDFIVFFFLFGWFWNTVLFKKFKKLECVELGIKLKVHYHVLNMCTGILQGYFIRLIIPMPPKYQNHITLVCALLAGFSVLLSMRSHKLHCFCILLLPTLASRHGRRFVLVLLFASLLNGPVSNMNANTGLITTQMNCIAEKAKNTSDVIVDSIKERYKRLHNHVIEIKNKTAERMQQIQDNLKEVKERVNKKYAFLIGVVKKINDFIDKCESTMSNLNNKCQEAFKCGEKRSVDGLQLSYDNPSYHNFTTYEPWKDVFFTKPHSNVMQDQSPDFASLHEEELYNNSSLILLPAEEVYPIAIANTSPSTANSSAIEEKVPHHVYYHNKSRYADHPHTETLHTGKVFHIRSRRGIFDVIACFFKNLFSVLIRPICDIIFNSIIMLCRIPKLLIHFITSIILKKYQYLEQTIKKNAWIDVNSNMTFEREIVEVRSAKQAGRELEERIAERLDYKPPTWIAIANYLKLISMLLVYWNTYRYMSQYWRDSSFDNIYIDRSLIKFDNKAEGTIFPLKKSDTKKYIQMTQRSMSSHERFIATRCSLKALGYLILVLAVEGGDKILHFLIQLMYDYGPIRVEHFIDVKDLNDIESISTNTSRIQLLFDTKSCFSKPSESPLTLTCYHFGLGALILVMSMTQIYFLRVRHAICDSFHPVVRRRRAEFLHTKIGKSREYSIKHAAETLFAKISEQNKLCRLFPWLYKPACVVCSRRDYLQKCNECDTMYCMICLKDMNSTCKICDDLLFQSKSSQEFGGS